MLKSAEIVLLLAKGKVAHENLLTDNTCEKAPKLTMWKTTRWLRERQIPMSRFLFKESEAFENSWF